jgi:murein L,D-transpeptidase YcbB/YkuD
MQSRIAQAVLLALLCASGLAQAPEASSEGQTWLRTTISDGRLSDLRWPNFSDYRQHVLKFYQLNGDSLWWVKGMEPTRQAGQMIALLSSAGRKGLSTDDYDASQWSERLAKLKPATGSPSETSAVKFDLALTVCAMRYISDLHVGRVNPRRLAFALDDESKKYDLAEFLKDHVVNADDVSASLAQVEPPYPGYRRTMQALQTYAELARKDDGEQLPAVKKAIKPGDAYPGAARLTRLLRLVGDLPPDAKLPDPSVYDGALVDAVKSFQGRHGLDANGRIDAQTVAELNVPLSRRVQQMQWTLERWRWLPGSYEKAPIVANIPEFRLRAYDKDFNIAVTMKVVVGKSYNGHNTPVFSENMQYVEFRPYWNVPYSITRSEMVPQILKDPGYLTKKGLEVVDNRQNVVTAGEVSPEVLDQLRAGKLFVRQTPGPKNSLGLAAFMFPNSYAVYMHDTPAPELFSQSRRDFSHGCIRLEKPADMAAWVLRNNPGWTPERIHAAMTTGGNQRVNLAQPIPVLILYATVIVLDDGLVHFYDDIYKHDAALEKVLAKGYPYPW